MQGFSFLAKGKRSSVYAGTLNDKKVALKIFNQSSDRSFNEAYWLRKLNKVGIGPKLLSYTKGKIMYEFVDGPLFEDFIKQDDHPLDLILAILRQCRQIDRLKVIKEELQHPQKHIFVVPKRKIVMIDFENCHASRTPKNLTQCCQYFLSFRMRHILKKKGINLKKSEMIPLLKAYKDNPTPTTFRKIVLYIRKQTKKN